MKKRIEKKCSMCKKVKPISEFHRSVSSSDGHHNYCKACSRIRGDQYRKDHPHRVWARHTIADHKKHGFHIDLTPDELEKVAKKATHCYICHEKLAWSYGKHRGPGEDSPTLDRIDNEKHISLDNIAILCFRCNAAKGRMPLKEFISYCRKVAYNFSERM